jgi:cell division protein FtsI (penicillin-binding protein 3)
VTVSLDVGVQHGLGVVLNSAIDNNKAKAAAGIVMDVHSGEGVGLATHPD